MKKAQGFGTVGIVIIVAAIALIGVVAWRVYDASKANKSTQSSKGASTKDSSQQSNSNTQPSAQTTPTATYLEIKEWGVRIKLADNIKDTIYTTKTLSDGSQVGYFSTQSLVAADASCNAALGSLERTTVDTDRTGAKKTVNNVSTFKIGEYYYSYSAPQALCSEAVRGTEGPLRTAFAEALKTLEAY